MEKVVYSDLYKFNFLSDVVLSPDGSRAVFTKTNADKAQNGYKSELWLLDVASGAVKRLTAGGGERGAFWLDNETVIFSANREKQTQEGKKRSLWYRISVNGGEAEKFLDIPEKVTAIKRVSDTLWALVVNKSAVETPAEEKNRAKEGKDLLVFDEIPFWFNGKGVINKLRSTVTLYNSQTGELTPITPTFMDAPSFRLSADGKLLAYAGCEFTDKTPRESGLYIYSIETGDTVTVLPQKDAAVYSYYFMGDNELFYTTMGFEFNGMNPRYHIYDIAAGTRRDLPFCDAGVGGGVGTDCNYGGGNGMKYVGDELYFAQLSWGDAHLVRMDREGTITRVTKQKGSFTCFDIVGDTALLCAMRNGALIDIYKLDLATGEEQQLTHFNTDYMNTHSVSQPEYFTYQSKNGYEMEGWVIKPVGYEAGKKYPAVFEMHGGPKVTFGGIFHHEMQCFASMGYFVFYTNPRGSDGRGEDFANITENLGYIDFDDFMEFADVVCERYSDIDDKRIGICGGSYGGFMCNWMVGHTNRFAAAASQRSISNYLTKAFCTDNGYYHNMSQLGTDPWHDFETVWEHSPLKCAPRATTPTLFIQADEDYRCWMGDAVQMFTALKMNGTDARMVLFHGENHELSRSGKPENRLTRLREIGDWFEKYLKA